MSALYLTGRPVMSEASTIVERFRRAILDGDDDALRSSLSDEVFFAFGGESPFAGTYSGPEEVVSLFRAIRERSGSTFAPADPNSFDVLESEYHCALLDRWVARRGDSELSSHQVWVLHLKDGRVGDGFIYFENQRGFDAFWT